MTGFGGTTALFWSVQKLSATLLCAAFVFAPSWSNASNAKNSSVAGAVTLAAQPRQPVGRVTGFPLPRYVSLKSVKARMRVGPSADYPIRWVYEAQGLPMEIIEEYGSWRQVRDSDGTTGWMSAVLLSGNRTGLVTPWRDAKGPMVPLRSGPAPSYRTVAELQPGVRLNIKECDTHWCRVGVQNQGLAGYIRQGLIWGVYPFETIRD